MIRVKSVKLYSDLCCCQGFLERGMVLPVGKIGTNI